MIEYIHSQSSQLPKLYLISILADVIMKISWWYTLLLQSFAGTKFRGYKLSRTTYVKIVLHGYKLSRMTNFQNFFANSNFRLCSRCWQKLFEEEKYSFSSIVDKREKVEAKRGKRCFTFFRKFRGKFSENFPGVEKSFASSKIWKISRV